MADSAHSFPVALPVGKELLARAMESRVADSADSFPVTLLTRAIKRHGLPGLRGHNCMLSSMR